ncbi:hypothetical protein [Pseudomonas syringae group genomosp. 3]|uniref:hypothetical protein n=1 Tax=Pseudomonas syringae group genomosp. 3 TaxID=251701 RepID=UPI001F1F9134|nr:hypothetical protein [Pseudomonas syringae group genomosp. 3]
MEKQSSSLAQEANISPAEAEKRLAQALAYYTDKDWNNALAAKGVVPDALTLKHLGIALSPLADSYAAVGDVPVVAGSKSYTPAETVALITDYRNTHTAEYADPSINNLNMQGAYAGDPKYKYADFYRKNLAVNTDFLSAVSGNLAGIAQGSGGALSDSLGSAWALMSDPFGVSEQAANGLMGLSKNPWGSFKNSVEASQTKEAMATIYDMQGNTAASAAIRAKSDLEFALNFLPANRAKTLAELGSGAKATASKNLNPTGALTDSEAGTLVEREVLGNGAKATASTVGSTVQNGEAATGLLSTQLAKDVKSYLTDIQSLTGRQFTPQQLELLKADLRENTYSRLSKEEVKLNRAEFDSKLPSLRAEWEKNTGASWPKETYIDKYGNQATRNYDAHHVI